jgi:hypothetical protein
MEDFRKDLADYQQQEKELIKKIRKFFVIETIENLAKLGIKTNQKFSFFYSSVLEKPFILIDEKRHRYETVIPFKFLKEIFNSQYEWRFAKDGIIDFVETFAKKDSKKILEEIAPKVPFDVVQAQLSKQDELVMKLFDVDNAKDSYDFYEKKYIQLVKKVLKRGLILEDVKIGKNHQPLSWISDLASCALITIKDKDSEGYDCYVSNTHNKNYLVIASELFNNLADDKLVPLTQFHKDRYIPKLIKASGKYQIPEGDILDVIFYSEIFQFSGSYAWPDKTEYTPIAVNICSKLDIPSQRASEILRQMLGHDNSYNTCGNQMRFSDVMEYFTQGYNSDKGDKFLTEILGSLIKDSDKFKQDLSAEPSLMISIHNDNIKKLKKELPKSYKFLNDLFQFEAKPQNKPKMK